MRRTPWAKVGIGIVVLAAVVLLARRLGGYLPAFVDRVEGLGAWGPVVFIAGYAIGTVCLIPGTILTLAAGVLFGVARGIAFVFAGAMLGSVGAFLLARHGARHRVEQWLAGDRRFAALSRAVGQNGLKITFLIRLSPVFPYNLLNYALGLTRVRMRDYVLGEFGILPATAAYVYSGKVAGDVARAAAGGDVAHRGPGYWALVGVGLAATVAVTVIVTRIANRALREATNGDIDAGV